MYANLSAASRCYRGAILMSLGSMCVLSRAPTEYIDSSLSIHLAFPPYLVDTHGANKTLLRNRSSFYISNMSIVRTFSDSHYITFRSNRSIRERNNRVNQNFFNNIHISHTHTHTYCIGTREKAQSRA